jgi:hypothetical protein
VRRDICPQCGFEKDEFVEILQARASEIITEEQATAALRRIRPQWFEGDAA